MYDSLQLVEQFGKKGALGEQLQTLLERKADNCVNWVSLDAKGWL
jgi:hypothetical protein